jgi:hypothetical protein
MRNAIVVAVTMIALGLSARHGVNAQAAPNNLLVGTYSFNPTGSAELSPPTSGTCDSRGTSPAALTSELIFDGKGNIEASAHEVGTSIGATSCTPVNHTLTGHYTVTRVDTATDTFAAEGTFTIPPGISGGRVVRCDLTALDTVPFVLIGRIKDQSYTITTDGAGPKSTYAEGPLRGGPATCTAKILNFITSGDGRRLR